jgi:probable rRNA maturation factor
MRATIEVTNLSPLWRALPNAATLIALAVEASLATSAVRIRDGAEVGVQLADDAHVRALNLRWRAIDKATNVLSFPAAESGKIASAPMLGDIVLAFETVEREASEEGKSLAEHFAHLIVHGFLHLLGFDHETAADADRMEAMETRMLASLGIADPYASTVPSDASA